VQERRHRIFGVIERKVITCPECGGTGEPKLKSPAAKEERV